MSADLARTLLADLDDAALWATAATKGATGALSAR
jgi:hypothetical protein